jgi:predicted MFS family arabinose efflux permease
MFAMFLYLTLYIQNGLHLSPLATGVRFLPLTVVSFFVAGAAGRLVHAVPARLLFAIGLGAVGLGLLLMHGIKPDSKWTTLLPGFIVAGAGVGLCNPTIAQVAVGVVSPERSGMAAGINNTFRQVGIATGIAGLGAIFQARIASKASALLTASGMPGGKAHTIAHAIATERSGSGGGGAVARAAQLSFISALNEILMVACVVAFTGAVLGALLVRSSDFAFGTEQAAEPAPVAA